jgi:iron complex outermembrane receptor protein
MTFRVSFLSAVLSLCASWLGFAQDVTGTVVDELGKPLAQAHCVVGKVLTMTDEEGRFAMQLGLSQARLTVSHVGHQTTERTLSLPASNVMIVLRLEDQVLAPAVVKDAFVRPHSATRTNVREMPVQELDAVPATSRLQALKSVAGVQFVSAGSGMIRPVLRGLSGLRVATQFLGSRVESQAWGEGHGIFFPEQGVSRIEVIRGAEALQYGPDAYGGVINVVPTGPLSEPGRLTRVSFTGHSNTKGSQSSWMTQKRSPSRHHVLLMGVNRFGEYQLPDATEAVGSQLRQFYSQGRFGYLQNWGTWEGAYSSCYNTAGIVGYGGTQQSGDHMLTTGAHFRWGEWDWHPTLSYQLNHRKELAVVPPDSLTEDNEQAHTELDLSLRTTRYDVRAHRKGDQGWEWSLGSQGFSKTNQNDTAFIDLERAFIPDAAIQGAGVFAIASKPAASVVPAASIRGDVHRVAWSDRAGLHPDAGDLAAAGSRDYGMVSGALGATWQARERHRLGAHVMQGNRAPGLSELLAFGMHHDSFREEQGNVDLKAETSRSVELQWVMNSTAEGTGWSGDVALYASRIANYMLLVPTGQTNDEGLPIQLHQATLAWLAGADVNATWQAPRELPWSAHVALSVVDAQDEAGEALPWTPPATGRFELRRAWHTSGRSQGSSSVVVEASRDAVLVHASTSWDWGERIRLNAQVINASNVTYIPTLSLLRNVGMAEPGRNVRVQVVYTL